MTQGYIWSEIEPNCSVIAACLPTFGPLFTNGRSTVSRFRSPRSFLSFKCWWPIDRKTAVDGVQDSGRESTNMERITAGKAWQKIERSNNSVNIASARPERDNVEAQPELSTNILVTRGFGSEYGESWGRAWPGWLYGGGCSKKVTDHIHQIFIQAELCVSYVLGRAVLDR